MYLIIFKPTQAIGTSRVLRCNFQNMSFYGALFFSPWSQWTRDLGAYGLKIAKHWNRVFESCSRHECISAFFCVVLSCIDRGLAMGRSPIQGVQSNYLKDLVVSDVNSESEQARGPNPQNVQHIL